MRIGTIFEDFSLIYLEEAPIQTVEINRPNPEETDADPHLESTPSASYRISQSQTEHNSLRTSATQILFTNLAYSPSVPKLCQPYRAKQVFLPEK